MRSRLSLLELDTYILLHKYVRALLCNPDLSFLPSLRSFLPSPQVTHLHLHSYITALRLQPMSPSSKSTLSSHNKPIILTSRAVTPHRSKVTHVYSCSPSRTSPKVRPLLSPHPFPALLTVAFLRHCYLAIKSKRMPISNLVAQVCQSTTVV